LIDGIADVEIAEEGGAEETWDVGVIHAIHCKWILVWREKFAVGLGFLPDPNPSTSKA